MLLHTFWFDYEGWNGEEGEFNGVVAFSMRPP
jgi:hypothetical protein